MKKVTFSDTVELKFMEVDLDTHVKEVKGIIKNGSVKLKNQDLNNDKSIFWWGLLVVALLLIIGFYFNFF